MREAGTILDVRICREFSERAWRNSRQRKASLFATSRKLQSTFHTEISFVLASKHTSAAKAVLPIGFCGTTEVVPFPCVVAYDGIFSFPASFARKLLDSF
jgi:hypothetical protein